MNRGGRRLGLADPQRSVAGIDVAGMALQVRGDELVAFERQRVDQAGPVGTRRLVLIRNRMAGEMIPKQIGPAAAATKQQHVEHGVEPAIGFGRRGVELAIGLPRPAGAIETGPFGAAFAQQHFGRSQIVFGQVDGALTVAASTDCIYSGEMAPH